ncbi:MULTISPECIES: hypothetical protein [unclassified Comamonas]|uniref:hypothetical protein n=1 Tax=unclassified Comamonas TaxID=2638500 RepID=UPI0006373DB6|nr:hypothetical protein [Comamonas sp. E6]GAO73544.1 dipeptidase D [Comamonas sp. E6]
MEIAVTVTGQLTKILSGTSDVLSKAVDRKVLEVLPGIKAALEVAESVRGLRDRIEAEKLARFIRTLDGLPEIEKYRMFSKAAESSKEMEDLGQRVVLAISLANDFSKPEVHAKLFIAFAEGKLTATELARLISVIAPTHTPDLIAFANVTNPHMGELGNRPTQGKVWRVPFDIGEPISVCGFTRSLSLGGARSEFMVTDAGLSFHTALNEANTILGRHLCI